MSASFYFYDLETTGVNARTGRIMQFAGQRTDMELRPIGEPDNLYIKLTDDVLPEPDAILITGITPQKTQAEGITEAEFLAYFSSQIAVADTIFVGFNNIRFDDEFMRFVHYRNFHDAYEWSWKDGRGRWDILDLSRVTRALRPDGIEWPFAPDGRPSNRLELLTGVNKLDHVDAHDALSDVNATIAVARLIRNKQPKLFDYLLRMRDKNEVKKLVAENRAFLYTSGKYPTEYQKTTAVTALGEHPGKQGVLVYDLRIDPDKFRGMSAPQLAQAWQTRYEEAAERFPVKTMQFNRCPGVAPLGVVDEATQERLALDMEAVRRHLDGLEDQTDLYQRLLEALKIMDRQRQGQMLVDEQAVDSQLYDGFFGDQDRTAMSVVRAADKTEIGSLTIEFSDERLTKLLPLYKARNFPDGLSPEEREAWETFRTQRLMGGGEKSQAARYFARLGEIAQRESLSAEDKYLLEELQLYGEAILPAPEF